MHGISTYITPGMSKRHAAHKMNDPMQIPSAVNISLMNWSLISGVACVTDDGALSCLQSRKKSFEVKPDHCQTSAMLDASLELSIRIT